MNGTFCQGLMVFFCPHRWSLNGTFINLSLDRRRRLSGGNLIISSLDRYRDVGVYQCMAYNTAGAILSRRAHLKFACKSLPVTLCHSSLRGGVVVALGQQITPRPMRQLFAIFIRLPQPSCEAALNVKSVCVCEDLWLITFNFMTRKQPWWLVFWSVSWNWVVWDKVDHPNVFRFGEEHVCQKTDENPCVSPHANAWQWKERSVEIKDLYHSLRTLLMQITSAWSHI